MILGSNLESYFEPQNALNTLALLRSFGKQSNVKPKFGCQMCHSQE